MSDQYTEPTPQTEQSPEQAPPAEQPPKVEASPPVEQPPKVVAWEGDGVFTGLTVQARRLSAQGRWVFGVELGGAFVSFADMKLGGVDDDLREAAQEGFKAERAATYRTEVLGR